jgi:hypothetical protein
MTITQRNGPPVSCWLFLEPCLRSNTLRVGRRNADIMGGLARAVLKRQIRFVQVRRQCGELRLAVPSLAPSRRYWVEQRREAGCYGRSAQRIPERCAVCEAKARACREQNRKTKSRKRASEHSCWLATNQPKMRRRERRECYDLPNIQSHKMLSSSLGRQDEESIKRGIA